MGADFFLKGCSVGFARNSGCAPDFRDGGSGQRHCPPGAAAGRPSFALPTTRKFRPMARKSLENATFYHGVALPRQSSTGCCQNPTFFCTGLTPVLYFPGKQRIWRDSGLHHIFAVARVFRVRKNLSKTKA